MTEEPKVLTIEDNLDPEMCAAITNSGAQCKRKPLPGSKYCQIPAHQALAEPEEEFEPCGHVNMHSYGADGKLDFLKCEREKGHDGDHGAWHYEVRYGPSLQDEINPRVYHTQITSEGEVWAEWSDMAGIPAEEIKPEPLKKKPGILDAFVASGAEDDFWADEDLP